MDVVGVLELKSLATRMARGDNAVPDPARTAVRLRIDPRDEAAGDLPRGTAVDGAGGGRVRRDPGPGDHQRPDGRGGRPAGGRECRRGCPGGDPRGRLAAGGRLAADRRPARADRKQRPMPRTAITTHWPACASTTSAASRTQASTSTGPAGCEVVDLDGARVDKLLLRTLSDEQADELTA